jgi:ankyrin repeat protein
MATTLTVDEVNALIAEHSAGAGDAVGQLATPCQQGEDGQTPLNVAIESGNHGITSQLVESKEGINFAPSIDADLLAPVKHTVSAMFNGENVEETEKYLIKSFGPRMCWQRTPLHTACRYANEDAIELLISRNASLTAKDILGLTPLELCLQFGGEDSVSRFVACCTTHNRRLPITELVLKTVCRDPLFYQQLIEQGALDAKAKRFAFNLACALLDKDGMDQMLSQKLDINKTMNDEFSPVMEVCTSRLLTFCEHPEAPRLAGQLAAASNAASGAIHIDNDAIMNAESLEDLEKLFGGAFDEQADKQAELTSYTLSEQERQLQLKQRLSLIDYLAQQGLDVGMAESKAPYGFLGEIVSMNSPERACTRWSIHCCSSATDGAASTKSIQTGFRRTLTGSKQTQTRCSRSNCPTESELSRSGPGRPTPNRSGQSENRNGPGSSQESRYCLPRRIQRSQSTRSL